MLEFVQRVRDLGDRAGSVERGLDDALALHLADVLREVTDGDAAIDRHLAVVGLLFARQQTEQRRLAGAVRTDESDLLAAVDDGRSLEEEDLAPVALRERVDPEHGRGGVTKRGRIGI